MSTTFFKAAYFAVCISMVALAGISQAQVDLDAVMAVWNFDEGQGDTIKDSSGNGRDGTLMNGPTWVAGNFGMALSFDGDDDFVEINDPTIPEGTSHTISVWVNPGDNQRVWVDLMGNHTGAVQGYAIEQLDANTNAFFHTMTSAGGWNNSGAMTTPLVTGEWNHFALVRDGVSLRHFLNGMQTVLDEGFADEPIVPADNFIIGHSQCCGDRQFNGIIDQVMIFGRALSEDEIGILAAGVTAVSSRDKLTTTWGNIKITNGWD